MTAIPTEITRWLERVPTASVADIVADPSIAAVFCTDMTIGFCRSGALASPRIDELTKPVVELFERAYTYGIGDFVLVQDAHKPDAAEFVAFPPHSMRGTDEARTIPELIDLLFAEQFTLIEKNSLHPALGTDLDVWLDEHALLRSAIVVGNCTDLCVYQLAMHLRLRANALDMEGFEVMVPASCVNTYDLPAESAPLGAMAHDGDLFNAMFLYHLALNGVRVVRDLS